MGIDIAALYTAAKDAEVSMDKRFYAYNDLIRQMSNDLIKDWIDTGKVEAPFPVYMEPGIDLGKRLKFDSDEEDFKDIEEPEITLPVLPAIVDDLCIEKDASAIASFFDPLMEIISVDDEIDSKMKEEQKVEYESQSPARTSKIVQAEFGKPSTLTPSPLKMKFKCPTLITTQTSQSRTSKMSSVSLNTYFRD